ncbi:hypothetical protein OUZ56_003433 [Daphnia magna]|uniref:Uncharacterized protein n=1 Tax=Daphnia magna TaxID=35525 RepID=A0ABR0A901_9CRUS|nr:hypothetical protein OUZ56_003433 [Daphnia magna]
MAAAGQMRREQAQLRKVFNESWTHLARELLFLEKVTMSVKKANRALDWTADVLHGWQTGFADPAIGRRSTSLVPRLGTDTSITRRKWLESVPVGQGGGGAGERQRSFVHSSADLQCVSYAGSHQQRGVGIPFERGIGSIPGGYRLISSYSSSSTLMKSGNKLHT